MACRVKTLHPTRHVASLLLAACFLALAGCPWSTTDKQPAAPQNTSKPGGVVRLLVVDDPPLSESIEREWKARAEGELEVRQITSGDLVGLAKLSADAVIYPAGLLGELAERDLIVPLPDDVLGDEQFSRRDLLPLARHEIAWGAKIYAVPFGSPQLTILYRADLFEKLGLNPPRTWAEYQATAARLADRDRLADLAPPKDDDWQGACEPLGPLWAGQVLLARAACYARHPDQYSSLFDMKSMEPLIDGPPFVKALEELAAAAKAGPPDAVKFTPHDARREFFAGRCAMALCWPTGSRADAKVEGAKISAAPAGFAELPGSPEVYSFPERKWTQRREEAGARVPLLACAGRLGSVTRESRRTRQAFNLLVWLAGKEWSGQIASQSRDVSLFRATHLASPADWVDSGLDPQAVAQYVKLVEQTHQRPVWLFSVRIPGRGRYLAALDEAVARTLKGEKPPAEALNEAAEKWRGITAELGLEKQRRAYQRSLGLDPM